MKYIKVWIGIMGAAALFAWLGMLVGCASLAPGADPLVVRVEQVQTIAPDAFNTVLYLDDANRGWWATNAPAFHRFCEWLRTPQLMTMGGTNRILPRDRAMLWSLDQVKLRYKEARASSNDLYTALGTLQGVLDQACAWRVIVISPAPMPVLELPK